MAPSRRRRRAAGSSSRSIRRWRCIGNQTYVASYHTNVGHYSVNRTYFLPQFTPAFTRAPLSALIDGQDGPNGVYSYGPHAFPTQTFLQSNYWVDVVFELTANQAPVAVDDAYSTNETWG